MYKLWFSPLDPPLPSAFKLIKAPVPVKDIIGLLNRQPCLLTALFEFDGEVVPVIVDTGATISFLPEHGAILKTHRLRLQPANVNVRLANNGTINLEKKVQLPLRPKGSICAPALGTFYVGRNTKDVLGHEGLIGLNTLRLFDIDIVFGKAGIRVMHQGKSIGHECSANIESGATIQVDTQVENVHCDTEISSILRRYKSVFTDLDLEPIRGEPMRIKTVHQKPIAAKQKHYNTDEILQMKEHVKSLLDKGIIEPTTSGYAATSRIIPKKSGAGRLVVNYIPLNAVTVRDSYSLPHISDIFGVLQGQSVFSTMDCAQGFYQILVDQRDRHKTAFSTPVGNYQFVRCPFGAKNSCATFQAEMNRIFSEGLYSRCVIYVDDILVFGKTRGEHDANLAWVLNRCKQYNVKIKLEKCKFAQKEVEYLGFCVSGRSIRPLKAKLESLRAEKPPQSKTELKSVIGKLNFYSRFIPNYSKLLEPIRSLLLKESEFEWTSSQQIAYNKILSSLEVTSEQILADTMEHKFVDLVITLDSIEVLCMDANERMISRASRFLTSAEANYSIVEKQLLALVFATEKFRIWLHPKAFTVRVATKGLDRIFGMKNRPERVENLLLKLPAGYDSFVIEISESIPFKAANNLVEHLPEEIYYVDGACRGNGKKDCVASWAVCAEYNRNLSESGLVDVSPSNNTAELTAAIKACLIARGYGQKNITIVTDSKYLHSAATKWIERWSSSEWLDHKRKPVVNTQLFKELHDARKGLNIDWIHVKGHSDHEGNARADHLARKLIDPSIEAISAIRIEGVNIQEEEDDLIREAKEHRSKDMVLENDIVFFVDKNLPEGSQKRLYVPRNSRGFLVKLAHDDPLYGGHLGIKKTYRKLIQFWWPKMYRNIEEYVKTCETCQVFKSPKGMPPGCLHSIPISAAFEHVHVDIVGPLKRTFRGNNYVITATDAFTKWAFAMPCQNIKTQEVIKFLEDNIISIHGKPTKIITDRGSQFISDEWRRYMEKMNVDHTTTSPYHPQANGIDERLNGTLMRILKAYVNDYQEDWDIKLKWALYAYNTTVHDSTGYSPYQLLHGLDPRSPLGFGHKASLENSKDVEAERINIRKDADRRNKQAQEIQRREYDARHREVDFFLGQLVLMRDHSNPEYLTKKLMPKWYGPCIVVKVTRDKDKIKSVAVIDLDTLKRRSVALKDLKPYHEPASCYLRSQVVKSSCDKPNDSSEDEDLYASKFYENADLDTSSDLDAGEDDRSQVSELHPRHNETRNGTEEPEDHESDRISTSSAEDTAQSRSEILIDGARDDPVIDPDFHHRIDDVKSSDRVLRSQKVVGDINRPINAERNATLDSEDTIDVTGRSSLSTNDANRRLSRIPIAYNLRPRKQNLPSSEQDRQ